MKKEIKYQNQNILTLHYNEMLDNKLTTIYAKYFNGNIVVDPFSIALSLIDIPEEIIEENKESLSYKKVVQYFKNKVNYNEILYELTGGTEVWQSNLIELNFDKMKDYWQKDFDSLLAGCFTIYDLIIMLKYFKHEIVKKRFDNFIKIENIKININKI